VAGAPGKLCRRLVVGLLGNVTDSGARGVDAKCELHSLDGAGGGILAGLAVALLFSSALANAVGGVAVPVVGGLEFLNTPKVTGIRV